MAASKGYQGLSPAEQRAARDERLAAQVDGVELAKAREMKMVASLGRFTDECRWFMANKVWLVLGYETLVAWWADRIAPLVDGMGLTPGPELAQLAIEAIQEEEAALPAAQRHSKKALSAMVGASEWKVRGRRETRQDRSERRSAAVRDLEDDDNVIDAEFVEHPKTAAVTPPEVPADGGEVALTAPDDPPASGPSTPPPVGGPGVTPDEVEQYPCEACGGEIERDQRAVGYARCDACDPDGDHHRPELDEGGLGQCSMCFAADAETAAMVGEPAGFTARQREDAARQFDYLERGALTVVGPVKHFMDVECPVAENADETPRWATDLAKTTCLDCLRVVAQDSSPGSAGEAPAGRPEGSDSPEVVPEVAADRPGTEPPAAEDGADTAGAAPGDASPRVGAPDGFDMGRDGDRAVEGEAEHSLSTDPASELISEVTDLVHRVDEDDRFDADVLGPLLTADQLDELHGAVEQLAHFVGLLERWRTP